MAFNTGNPIGSTSPKDLSDNARNLDLLSLGNAPSYLDRKDVPRKSWRGMEEDHNADQARRESEFDVAQDNREASFNNFMEASGYEPPIAYVPGIVLDRTTKTVSYLGKEYRSKGEFIPFTTSSWAADEQKLKLIGDDSLKQELARPEGAGQVGWGRGLPGSQSGDIGKALNVLSVSVLEFSHLVAVRPNPTDAETWDWAPAFRAAVLAAVAFGINKVTAPKATYSCSPVYFTGAPIKDVEVDLQGSTVKCIGARTMGTRYDWEYGVFTFHGADSGVSQTVTLPATLPENTSDWTVANSAEFTTGDYWILEIDPDNNPDEGGDFSTKKVWRLLQCTSINSGTSVSFDYARVFLIDSGVKVKYTKVNPVENVTIKNVKLIYDRPYTAGDATSQLEASSGVTFSKAVNCKAENVSYKRSPKQAVHFEFSHGCLANSIEMYDPIEDVSGGYCVQFEKSIYFEAEKCRASKDRHLFDATASSNGTVSECSGFNSDNSSFTTHGTWEHDIDYVGNVGHFQLAGSGPGFGQTSIRITLRNHVGTVLNAVTNVSDLTIENSRFTSISNINVDGLRISNSEFLNDVRLTKTSSNSKRESTAEQTYFKVGANFFNLSTPHVMTMVRCTLLEMLNGALAGVGQLILLDCTSVNTGTSNTALSVTLTRLEVRGGVWQGLPILLADNTANQIVIFEGGEVSLLNRPTTLALVQTTKTGGSLELVYAPRKSTTSGRHLTANNVGISAATKIMLRDTELKGGSIQVQSLVVAGGWFMRSNVIYNGCGASLPALGARIGVGSELTIP